MKLTQTGEPLRSARSIVPPPTLGSLRAGAGSPMWNRVSADGEAEAAPDGEADAARRWRSDAAADAPGSPDAPALGLARRHSGSRRRSHSAMAPALGAGDRCGRRRRGRDRCRGCRPEQQDGPDDQARDGHAGDEAGDDRQTWPHGREGTSTSGPRRASEGRCYHAGPMSGLRTRLLPAVLTALGVTFLAAGLLTYTTPVTADAGATATIAPAASDAPVTPAPLITLPPLGSAPPTAQPTIPADRVATRVRIAALDIDLPVVAPGKDTDYPLCDVAMWFDAPQLGQPGEGRATYLYAHARDGHVPAAARALEGEERQEHARHDRRGLDERRPEVPLRDQPGAPPPEDARRRLRREGRASSGSRRPRVRRARSASSRSRPSRCPRRPPTTRPPTRSRTRSSAAEGRRRAGWRGGAHDER